MRTSIRAPGSTRPTAARHVLDDAFGDRQSKPGAALLFRDRRVGLLELLEDFCLLGFGDAGTGVTHRDVNEPLAAEALIATSPPDAPRTPP
jgi:hypothetical protein